MLYDYSEDAYTIKSFAKARYFDKVDLLSNEQKEQLYIDK